MVRFPKTYLSAMLLLLSVGAFALSAGEQLSYRRSALAEAIIYHSEDTFGRNIQEAFESIPVSDKYDDHTIGIRVIDNDRIPDVRKNSHGLVKAKYGKTLNKEDIRLNGEMLERILNEANCAKWMVAKWFGWDLARIDSIIHDTSLEKRERDSLLLTAATMNMQLIQQRGQYNATDLDVQLAGHTARGVAALSDAGEELIGNTFMLVNDITYVTTEERAAVAKMTMNILGGVFDILTGGEVGRDVAKTGGQVADLFTGFTVKTHSYLFQLQWHDSIAAIFYNNYYSAVPDKDKIPAFLHDSTTFRMKYVAHEYEYDGKAEVKGKYDRHELVKMICTRSIDKNIAALQLAYEDFKVKTPVYEIVTNEKGKIIGYSAKIGMKEGITEQSKFQVIEHVIDPEKQTSTYRHVADLRPVKGEIWDNRYNAVLEHAEDSELNATLFKKTGGGEILPGMLIIEGKYKKVTQ